MYDPAIEVDYTGQTCTTALIDADSIVYIIAWNNREVEDETKVLKEASDMVSDILIKMKATQYAGFFSPKKTFRHDVAITKPYKGNRPSEPVWVTKWKAPIINYLVKTWDFKGLYDWEADDCVALLQRMMLNSVICSPDKDLKQINGKHFNYAKGTEDVISKDQAIKTLCTQMLVGDTSDNITGVPKIGEVKASALLSSCTNSKELLDAVQLAFENYYGDEGHSKYLEISTLISMLQPHQITEEQGIALFSCIHAFELDNALPSEYLAKKELEAEINPFE